jgi:hypothetical protein
MPNTTTATETVTCACCLRPIVEGKKSAPKRHGWSVQGNRQVGSYMQSWHTGPCEGVRFPHLRESREGADYMMKRLSASRADLARTRGLIERSEMPLTHTAEIGSQLFNSRIVCLGGWPTDAQRTQAVSLARLAGAWFDTFCPMGVECRGVAPMPRKNRNDQYIATFNVGPGFEGATIRASYSFYVTVPSYAKLREAKLAEIDANIASIDAMLDAFREALVAHGW